jgi:hypothetical protein
MARDAPDPSDQHRAPQTSIGPSCFLVAWQAVRLALARDRERRPQEHARTSPVPQCLCPFAVALISHPLSGILCLSAPLAP